MPFEYCTQQLHVAHAESGHADGLSVQLHPVVVVRHFQVEPELPESYPPEPASLVVVDWQLAVAAALASAQSVQLAHAND